MRKLIQGIVEFRRNVRDGYRDMFGKLAEGQQAPDTLFVACSDSRVVPNTFASTNPGDLFVLRNMGNMVPPCDDKGLSKSDESEAAAIEFAVLTLEVPNIVVCGHSECGAMRAIVANRRNVQSPNLKRWLRHGARAWDQLKSGFTLDPELSEHNQLSQLNVLLQMEHIKSYPPVKQRIDEGKLAIHGLWYDIAKADVYAYEDQQKKFILIDEVEAERLYQRLGH